MVKKTKNCSKAFADSCFATKNSLINIPPELEVELCAHCSSTHVGDKWLETEQSEEELIEQNIVRESVPDEDADDVMLEIDLLNQKGSVLEILVIARGNVVEVPIKREYKINVKLNRNVCPECNKYASGYYEAVLQLRADERSLESYEIQRTDKIIKRQLEKLSQKNRMAYLSQRLELKEGVDYYFGSYKAAGRFQIP